MEKKYVMDEEWDYLIVLDACRYDFFKNNYKDILSDGELEKVKSPGRGTIEWLVENFKDNYDDTIYVSSTPYVNSKIKVSYGGYKFDGKSKFHKIYDVWDYGWNDQLNTVLPSTINNQTIKISKNHRDKRFIIHYMQPHAPYLSLKDYYESIETDEKHDLDKSFRWEFLHTPFIYDFMINLGNKILKHLGTELIWKLNRIFRFRKVEPSHMEMAWRILGKEGLKKAYEKNVTHVLNRVSDLIANLQGRIVITSDHGELLGEDGLYEHGPALGWHKKLINIPWLKINK
ncbi:MAG: sulfatase-like hydrolase/transferase [archaeon]